MTTPSGQVSIALEIGSKRTFASALDWPGWARSGRDDASALEALLAYAPRYQRAISAARLGFYPPAGLDALVVVERLEGSPTTDFGAPGAGASAESVPVDAATLERLQSILAACWRHFAKVVESSAGKELRKGPRGGGRSVARIFQHVTDAHRGYLRQVYWREPVEKSQAIGDEVDAFIEAGARALAFATSDDMPETGPRGGALWKPRYFVRRAAWHLLDHAWEIEDRLQPPD